MCSGVRRNSCSSKSIVIQIHSFITHVIVLRIDAASPLGNARNNESWFTEDLLAVTAVEYWPIRNQDQVKQLTRRIAEQS